MHNKSLPEIMMIWLCLGLTAILIGCGPAHQTLSNVEKNLEEKRLVPVSAVRERHILDEYDHLFCRNLGRNH